MGTHSAKTGTVYWITGLSGAGKSTVASLFYQYLRGLDRPVLLLDGDELRNVYGDDLGHGKPARLAYAMRNARLCRLLSNQGMDVVCATISLFHECHEWNRKYIPHYREVVLECPISILKQRDPKSIYKEYDEGKELEVAGLGIDVEFPLKPHVTLKNDGSLSPDQITEKLISELALV